MKPTVEVALISERPELTEAARALLEEYLRLPDGWRDGKVPEVLPAVVAAALAEFPGPAQPLTGDVAVALVGDECAGAVHVVAHVRDVARLQRMFVRPPFRKGGVATALLAAALERATVLGYEHAELDVLASREPAVDLYRRHGFTDVAPYADYGRPTVFLGLRLGR